MVWAALSRHPTSEILGQIRPPSWLNGAAGRDIPCRHRLEAVMMDSKGNGKPPPDC